MAEQPPRVGDWALTIGNAFGLGDSVTAGIVSARQRTIDASSGQDFLQIDAPINKGDSGGPTIDTNGDIITSLGGAPVRDAGELTRKVHAAAPDSSVRLDTLKRGKSSPVNVTLSQLPNSPQAAVPERQFRRALGDDPNSVLNVDHDLAVRRLGFDRLMCIGDVSQPKAARIQARAQLSAFDETRSLAHDLAVMGAAFAGQ